MAKINLRDFYPFYCDNFFVEVPDDLAQQMLQWERDEKSYERKRRRHRANYSLDCGNELDRKVLFVADTPEEHYERQLSYEQLHAALARLPDKQAKRIYAHYFMGMNKAEIARAEKVSVNAVKDSILHGLANMEKELRK